MAQVKSLQTGIKFKDTPIGKIPVDWEARKLGDVCEVIGGSTPSTAIKEYWDGDILWATPTDITKLEGRTIEETKQKISEKGLKSCAANLLPKGSILMTSRATIGACAINAKPMATNQGFSSLVCSKRAVNWFIYYLVLFFRKELERLGSGSTFKEISKKSVKALYVPLPPLSEQKKIAEILTTVDDAIEETDRIIEKTNELKKGLMQKLLTCGIGHKKFKKTEIGKIPEEWKIEKLESLGAKEKYAIVDGPFGSSVNTSVDYISQGIPVIRTVNIRPFEFIEDNLKFISEEKYQELQRSAVRPGDVLLSKVGTVGYACILPEHIRKAVLSTTGSCKITVDKTKIIAAYLCYYLNYLKPHMDKIAAEGVQPFLNMSDIKSLKIALPSPEEQKRILDKLSAIDSSLKNESSNKQSLETLKKSLMQILLTGRVRVKLH